jgi:hypothetical protein
LGLNKESVVSRLFTVAERDVAAIVAAEKKRRERERERESFEWCFLVLVFLHGCFERISSRR